MILAIDIGNSDTVLGISRNEMEWDHIWRTGTLRGNYGVDWAICLNAFFDRDRIDRRSITRCVICSVVPSATNAAIEFSRSWLKVEPLVITSGLKLNIKIGITNPEQVGADRIANAVAARNRTQAAAIVVDLGTATKVEAISADGVFLGGAIAPGIQLTHDALVSQAARLLPVPMKLPASAIGRNTIEAMQSGIVGGHMVLVRGLVHAIATELGDDSIVPIVTGGHADDTGSPFRTLGESVPTLTLDGVLAIARLNTSQV